MPLWSAADAARRQQRRREVDHGYATVWAVGWMLVLGVVAWAAVLVTVAVARQHRVDGAADVAALAGAQALQHGEDGCGEAGRVAEANGVSLSDCRIDDEDVLVQVWDSVELAGPALHVRIQGRARAGPQ
jgi:secretion/DNA translocation related TadE-like protein